MEEHCSAIFCLKAPSEMISPPSVHPRYQEVRVEQEVDTAEMDIGIGSIINQEESVEAIKHQFSLAWISVKNVSLHPANL